VCVEGGCEELRPVFDLPQCLSSFDQSIDEAEQRCICNEEEEEEEDRGSKMMEDEDEDGKGELDRRGQRSKAGLAFCGPLLVLYYRTGQDGDSTSDCFRSKLAAS
jgi:hypothetical protein